MKHVTVICDFCEQTIVNYTLHSEEDLFENKRMFHEDACDECWRIGETLVREAIKANKNEGKQ